MEQWEIDLNRQEATIKAHKALEARLEEAMANFKEAREVLLRIKDEMETVKCKHIADTILAKIDCGEIVPINIPIPQKEE